MPFTLCGCGPKRQRIRARTGLSGGTLEQTTPYRLPDCVVGHAAAPDKVHVDDGGTRAYR